MTYVVIENCINCKHTDCVEVCPVDCFYEGENMMVIDPEECIDCAMCEPECPCEAIVHESDVPYGQENFIEINAQYCQEWANCVRMKESMPNAYEEDGRVGKLADLSTKSA